MRPLAIFGWAAAAMLICLGVIGTARAQDGASEANPPERAAQLSDAEGSVSLEPAGTTRWTGAVLNRPLTSGDKLWTDQDSRAELDIGDAVIRLGSTTGFSFLDLDERTAQMQVTAGTLIVHVLSLASGEQDEIDTPNLALTLEQPGTYRVEVSDTGDTTIVKVDAGEALATGGGESFPVAAQQSVTFTGTGALTADYATLGAPDALDEWSFQRDQEEQQQAQVAQQYVPADTVGGDDLGSYGTWEDTPDWGYAWFPDVAVDWAPYTLGSWMWVSPWGWTWVDEEPWGFAPFHYGRWGYWNRRWCWIPEPRRGRPVYAPALVAWIGSPHAGASRAGGARVGWLPLGPGDFYAPGFHGSIANARYVNSGIPGAVTLVPRNVFTSAQPVAPHRVSLPRQGGAGFQATTVAPAITPARRSVLGPDSGRLVAAPPRGIMNRPVVARLAPPRAPVSFAAEQAAIRANGGRPLAAAALARLQPNLPAATVRLATPVSMRERMLQRPSLPSAGAYRTDRPPWAQGRAMQLGQRPNPEQSFSPSERGTPAQRFSPPERQIPEPRFTPPPRQSDQPRFTPPPRQFTQPRFTAPAPHAAPAPARAPEARPAQGPPPRRG